MAEGRGSFIPRDAEETKWLQKFKAHIRDLTLNVALGKLCIAQYRAGMYVKALEKWTVHCDLCDCEFHCREVMTVRTVEKHVLSKQHINLLATDRG